MRLILRESTYHGVIASSAVRIIKWSVRERQNIVEFSLFNWLVLIDNGRTGSSGPFSYLARISSLATSAAAAGEHWGGARKLGAIPA